MYIENTKFNELACRKNEDQLENCHQGQQLKKSHKKFNFENFEPPQSVMNLDAFVCTEDALFVFARWKW